MRRHASYRRVATPDDSPAFSPDGRSVVFYSGTDAGGTLKKVATSGGAEFTLCATEAPFGVSWGERGIVFGERRGVMRVSADGGEPELLVAAKDGEAIYGPQVLPDRRSVLFTVAATTGGPDRWDKGRIVVQSLAIGRAQDIDRRRRKRRAVSADGAPRVCVGRRPVCGPI